MKSNKVNWINLKDKWQQELLDIYPKQEASNILLILAEELLPHYSVLNFRDSFFEITPEEMVLLQKGVDRLKTHEPLQYILGKAWFYDIELGVNASVLIPRPETEELVAWVLESAHPQATILDIGTGSGCIPLTLKKHLPKSKVSAIDVDPNALALAKSNGEHLQIPVDFILTNILDKEAQSQLGQFDIILSNPPYIPGEEKALMRENVLRYEPDLALFVEDEDALIFYREIASFAKSHLNKNGFLFFECNEYNAKAVEDILRENGFQDIELKKDLQGKDRMIKCTLNA